MTAWRLRLWAFLGRVFNQGPTAWRSYYLHSDSEVDAACRAAGCEIVPDSYSMMLCPMITWLEADLTQLDIQAASRSEVTFFFKQSAGLRARRRGGNWTAAYIRTGSSTAGSFSKPALKA